jgi:hypothetical protein
MNAPIFKALPISVLIFMKAVAMTGQISYVHGRIMEGDSRWPVYKVLVQNVSSHRWTSSDTSGFFHLPAAAGDTLVFSASGYYHRVEAVTDSMLNTAVFRPFKMDPLVYPIREANVFAIGTYNQFRQKFISLDLSKDKTVILSRNLQQESVTAARDAYRKMQQKQKMGGGVGVPILTPQEKERIKLREILAAESQKTQVCKKYNADILRKITGITADEEILEFMAFCSFSDVFILNTNEYDLMVLIARKYEEFLRVKKGMGSDRKGRVPDGNTLYVRDEIC